MNSGKLRDHVQRRILLLITDLRIGGTPTVVRQLAVRLGNDPDFHVHVACLDRWGPVADQLRDRGIPVTALNACCSIDLRIVFRLIRLIRRENIDTVFSFLIHANTVAALAWPFVRDVRFLQSIQTTQPKPRWHWIVQRAIGHAAERIVVPSRSVADAATQWAAVQPKKILVIPNAVEIEEFAGKPRQASGKRIGFIGRLDPIKRVEDLVTALSLLPADYTLDILGGGGQRDQIQSLISRLGLEGRAIMRGEIAGSALVLGKTDVLVLPSDAEGFGLVLIEAMAAAVPVIGTNVPGIRDVIEDGVSGLLVPPRNPHAIANAIEKILNDPLLIQKLVKGGSDRVRKNYNWSVQIDSYRNLLI
jgi:glycosyltransferase involved in cell wall biosynthesis